MFQQIKKKSLFRPIAIALIVFMLSALPAQSGYAQAVPLLSPIGQMLQPTGIFTPAQMIGLKIDPQNPFHFYFVMDKGDELLSANQQKEQYTKLIKHFLASLTVANKDMWVNLSPYESNRIIGKNLEQTNTGKELLAQDYILKQFTASLMYPEEDIGRGFWQKVYSQAYEKFKTTDIPINTFNKIWIRADQADIYQKDGTAFLVKSHLKVMLEKDYLAEKENSKVLASGGQTVQPESSTENQEYTLNAVREIIIPIIEKEVNEGKNFAPLRQIYNSMILATWYKKTLKETLLAQVYTDKNKVAGVQVDDPQAKEKIYEQYLQAFKVGVFNYIKEEEDPLTHETLPRKYFSGGMLGVDPTIINTNVSSSSVNRLLNGKSPDIVDTDLVNAIRSAYNDFSDLGVDQKVRSVEHLTARVHFSGEKGDFDGVSYADQFSAVGHLIDFAKTKPEFTGQAGQVVFYIPEDTPQDSVIGEYARRNSQQVHIVKNIEQLTEVLTKQTAIVLFPFAKSESSQQFIQTVNAKNPQALVAFSGARLNKATTTLAQQNSKGLIVVSEKAIAESLRAHRDDRQIDSIDPEEAWERLAQLKRVYAKTESSTNLKRAEKAAKTSTKKPALKVVGDTSGKADSSSDSAQLDSLWNRLKENAGRVAKQEPLLSAPLEKTILSAPDFKTALANLLASKLRSDVFDVDKLKQGILQVLNASPDILNSVSRDLLAVLERDPASGDISNPFLNFKGFHALAAYRIAHWLWLNDRQDLALALQNAITNNFGVDIHPGATIGDGVLFDHATGVVIGQTAVVGNNVYILHGVTLGANKNTIDGRRHPIVEDDVTLGAGAQIIGPITVGKGAQIGANATVTKTVLADQTVVDTNRILPVNTSENKPDVVLEDEGISVGTAQGFISDSISPIAAKTETLDELRVVVAQEALGQKPVAKARAPRKPPIANKAGSGGNNGSGNTPQIVLNPVEQVEQAITALETRNLVTEQYAGVSVASGVAGVHLPLRYALKKFTEQNPALVPEIILIRPAYGGTEGDVELYRKYGLKVKIVTDPENQLAQELSRNTAALIFETPANPSLPIISIKRTVDAVRSSVSPQAFIIFDGSFATSLGQQPLDFGVDAVVQVVTKGLSGDGNVFGAVIVAQKEIAQELRNSRAEPINRDDAIKLLRYGLPNLERRFFRQQENARFYVEWLKKNPQVEFVRYPGDQTHPQYGLAQKQMDNPGHMIYFDLKTEERAKAFMALLRYFRTIEHAVSLGDVRNLMQMPGYGALSGLSDEELRQGGVTRGGIRWAVGIEDPKDVLRELDAIFEILKIYDGKFEKIPFAQLDTIFMQPTTNVDGKTGYALRKYPVVKRDTKGAYGVEPDINASIAELDRVRDYFIISENPLKQTAQLINDATLITKYNPHTLFIHHTSIWGLLSGDHRSLVASGGNPSNAFRADDPDDLKTGFGWNGKAGDPSSGSFPAQGSYRTYGRFGNPASATAQLLLATAEAGAAKAFSQEVQGISAPSFAGAVNLLLKHWVFDTAAKPNGKPINIVVVTKKDSSADKLIQQFQENDGHLFEISGQQRVKFTTVSPDEQNFLRSAAFDKDTDYVLVDEQGLESRRVIGSIKGNAFNAKVAWINTQGIKRGDHPLSDGADITVLDVRDGEESVAGVLIVPQADVTGIGNHRNYNSIASRQAGEVILPHLFPYYLLPDSDAAASVASAPVGGIDLDANNLKINVKVDDKGFVLPVQFQDPALLDIPGLVPVIRNISPMTPVNMPIFLGFKSQLEHSDV